MRRIAAATAVAALFAGALALALADREPRRFADSEGYLWAAAQPLDLAFFASDRQPFELGPQPAPEDGLYRNRPWLVPGLYRLCALAPARIVRVQSLLYALGAAAGLVLLVEAAGAGASTPRRPLLLIVAALPLAAVALAWYVAGWSGVLLSESLVLALAWTTTGGVAVHLARGGRGPLILAWCAGAALLFARDSGACSPLPLFGGAALAALVSRERRRAELAVAGLLLLPLFLAAVAAATRGHRTVLPIANVLLMRVAPDPVALDWWRERGLPWNEDLERFRGGFAFEQELALFREKRYAPFLAFVEERGRGLLFRFLASHPAWVARETWRARDDLFGTDLATYVGAAPPLLAPIDRAVRGLGAGGAALVLLAWTIGIARRGRPTAADLAPFVIVAAFVGHSLAALHADAAEPERHVFLTAFGLQIAAAVVVARLVSGRTRAARARAVADPA